MYLLHIIPAINIPRPADQSLTYFTAQKIQPGGLVLVLIRKTLQTGLVIKVEPVKAQKAALRQASFKLRRVEKILSPQKIFPDYIFQFIEKEADYWWTSQGLLFKMILPAFYLNQIKKGRFLSLEKISARKKSLRVTVLRNTITPKEQILELYPYELNLENSNSYNRKLTPKQKFIFWDKVRQGKISKIIGTRSALFLPFANLKEIRVFEAESPAYKTWGQSPYYDARRTALRLAELTGAKITFYSPAPPLWLKAENYPNLKIVRPKIKPSAKVKIINLKNYYPKKQAPLLSPPALKILAQSSKSLVFHNRRGLARLTFCADCSYQFLCSQCQVPLILHQKGKKRFFVCHHCGLKFHIPGTCPKCQSHQLKTWGAGTQKIKELLNQRFLKKAIFELNQDNTPALSSQLNLIQKFKNEPRAILIATSQIIKFLRCGKSPKMPGGNLKFSAGLVPLTDLELNFPDYLNRENVFQNLYKLALNIKNELILQTFSPEAEFFKIFAKLNYPEFAKQELIIRKAFYYPPYSHLIKLKYQNKNLSYAEKQAKILFEKLQTQLQFLASKFQIPNSKFQILGPAPAFIPQVKGLHEWQIYLKIPPQKDLIKRQLLNVVPRDWKIDVEPMDTL